ncbi:MAG: 30S ribosomal protein S3 [Candidatus Paceibacterota bacterium]
MTHKVHPKSFRIRDMASWDSRGYYGKKPHKYLEEDFRIREFLQKIIGKFSVEKIEIERIADRINIIITTARPGLIIGRGGEGIELLKKQLDKVLLPIKGKKSPTGKREVKLEIREIKNPLGSASLVAQSIAQQIEKRMPFRKVLKQSLEKIMSVKGVEGCRLEVAGRLNGSEIARTEWLRKGRMPRQTIRADIDYSQGTARCTYGAIGIKVWIYKGEKFD